MKKSVFEKCGLWDNVVGGHSFDNFCNRIIPELEVNENVPEAIQRRISTIQRLLEYSYFEYHFLDIAMERCYHTLEFALHLKFKIENPNKEGKMNFKPYLDWAVQNRFLVITNEQKKALEYLRNHVTHIKDDFIGGITHLKMIQVVGQDMINMLFTTNSN